MKCSLLQGKLTKIFCHNNHQNAASYNSHPTSSSMAGWKELHWESGEHVWVLTLPPTRFVSRAVSGGEPPSLCGAQSLAPSTWHSCARRAPRTPTCLCSAPASQAALSAFPGVSSSSPLKIGEPQPCSSDLFSCLLTLTPKWLRPGLWLLWLSCRWPSSLSPAPHS